MTARVRHISLTRRAALWLLAMAIMSTTVEMTSARDARAATCLNANPCGLRVAGSTSTSISLAWSRPADTTRFGHYDVMKKTSTTGWVWVADVVPASLTSYRASGLVAGRTYSFQILQADAGDRQLGSSNVLTATARLAGSTTTSPTPTTTVPPTSATTVPPTSTTTVPSTTTTTSPTTTTTTMSTTTTTAPPPPAPPTAGWPGPAYWARWARSFPTSPDFFPIGVWLQDPRRTRNGQVNAVNYRNIGINTLVGIWGTYDSSHDAAVPAGMYVLPFGVNSATKASTKVAGYVVEDEPDMPLHDINAQGIGRCILAPELATEANAVRVADPDRPAYVNFGKGMALPDFFGGSNCPYPGDSRDAWRSTGSTGDYLPDQNHPPYEAWGAVADVVSIDHYSTTDQYEPASNKGAWGYGRMTRRLARYSPGKPHWAFIQVTNINDGAFVGRPSTAEVTAFVWLALVNGANGIEYFAHCFNPIVEDCLLADSAMTAHVGALNARISSVARQLNAPPVAGAVTASGAVVEYTVRDSGGRHIFAVGRGAGSTTFTGLTGSSVEVIGEGRSLPITGGAFTDSFAPYQVHLYRVVP